MASSSSTIVVIGPSLSGKSAVVRAYLTASRSMVRAVTEEEATPPPPTTATILDEYRLTRAGLTIVDTGGMDAYFALMAEQLSRATAVLYVFDITRRDTLLSLPGYLAQLRTAKVGETTTPVVICANKRDSLRARFAVTEDLRREEALRCAAGWSTVRYVEVSARTGDNMDALFEVFRAVVPSPPPATSAPSSARSDGSTPRSTASSAASSPRVSLTGNGCETM
jgi:small GTP-binding protein